MCTPIESIQSRKRVRICCESRLQQMSTQYNHTTQPRDSGHEDWAGAVAHTSECHEHLADVLRITSEYLA